MCKLKFASFVLSIISLSFRKNVQIDTLHTCYRITSILTIMIAAMSTIATTAISDYCYHLCYSHHCAAAPFHEPPRAPFLFKFLLIR